MTVINVANQTINPSAENVIWQQTYIGLQ